MIIRKSRFEIERMRVAGQIVARVLKRLSESAGASPTFKGYNGYPRSICASINDEVVHGIPSKRKLREGDIVGIDCGATYMGYVGDAAVTLPIGNVGEPIKRLLDATRQSLYHAIDKCQVGN